MIEVTVAQELQHLFGDPVVAHDPGVAGMDLDEVAHAFEPGSGDGHLAVVGARNQIGIQRVETGGAGNHADRVVDGAETSGQCLSAGAQLHAGGTIDPGERGEPAEPVG